MASNAAYGLRARAAGFVVFGASRFDILVHYLPFFTQLLQTHRKNVIDLKFETVLDLGGGRLGAEVATVVIAVWVRDSTGEFGTDRSCDCGR